MTPLSFRWTVPLSLSRHKCATSCRFLSSSMFVFTRIKKNRRCIKINWQIIRNFSPYHDLSNHTTSGQTEAGAIVSSRRMKPGVNSIVWRTEVPKQNYKLPSFSKYNIQNRKSSTKYSLVAHYCKRDKEPQHNAIQK